LTQVLNGLRPDFSSFPWQLSALDWIKAELTPEILKQLEIDNWEELLQGPRKYKLKGVSREVQGYPTETGKFQLMSRGAKENQLPALVRFKEQRIESPYPLRLLTPQSLLRLHSQYRGLSWLNLEQEMDAVELNPQDAEQRDLKEKDHAIVYNDRGSCFRRVEIDPYIPQGVVVMAQGDTTNQLLAGQNTDMGIHTTGARGAAFYDSWVEVKKK